MSTYVNTGMPRARRSNVTDGTVANTIFGQYGFTPDPGNLDDKSVITTAGTLAFDTGAGSTTLAGTQDQTAVLDDQGITLGAGSGKVVVGTSGVDLNSGALKVS